MRHYVYLLIAFLLVSCQDNFDEWNDTDLRRINFDIETEGFFDEYLTLSGTSFLKGGGFTLDPSHRLRLSCYCYAAEDTLVQHSYILMDKTGTGSIRLSHLQKDTNYRFELFADVVKFDNAVDYYESWFQLGTKKCNSTYLFCFQPDSIHEHNIVRHATIHAKPENNRISVNMVPVTVNGYCILSNLQDVEMVNGYYTYNESFFVNSMQGRKRSSHTYRYLTNGKKQIVIPITTGSIGDTLSVKIKRVMLNQIDSTLISVRNPENKSFVTEIDCKTLKQKSCLYY